jgi:ABC-2 type transport system permease protein
VGPLAEHGPGRVEDGVPAAPGDRAEPSTASAPCRSGAAPSLLGGLLSDAARYVFAAAIVVVLGLIMGYRPDGGSPGVLAAVALVVAFGLSLSLLWAAVALVIHDPAVVISIANVVLIPLSFASNVFIQPETMPGWLQAVVKVNPLSHVATAARDLMNNTGGTGGSVAWSLIATAAITLVVAPLTLHLYSKQG